MQEDILGPLHDLGEPYDPCARCGAVLPPAQLRVVPEEWLGEGHAEHTVVCASCWDAIERGEDLQPPDVEA